MHLLLVRNTHTSRQWWTSHKKQVHTIEQHTRTLQSSMVDFFSPHTNIPLNLFVSFKREPDRICGATLLHFTRHCAQRTERRRRTEWIKNRFGAKESKKWTWSLQSISGESNFFAVSSRVHASVYECQPKNQIKFNKKGKHISHNWA